MADKIIVRRGLKVDLPTLDEGEFGFCTDTLELFIGSDTGNILINDPNGTGGGGTTDTPPNNVTNLIVGETTSNSVSLQWTASSGATSYDIERDGMFIDTVMGTEYIALGLMGNTTYTFTVKAKNAIGTASGTSVQAETEEGVSGAIVLAKDSFNRANTTSLVNTACETGQLWSVYKEQDWGIQNNQVYNTILDSNDPFFLDVGQSDNVAMQVTVAVESGHQIMWRIADGDNYFCCDTGEAWVINDDNWQSVGSVSINNGDVFRVEVVGNQHQIYVNGNLQLTFTEASHATATRFGFSTMDTACRYDDFLVEAIGEGTGGGSGGTSNTEIATTWIGGVE